MIRTRSQANKKKAKPIRFRSAGSDHRRRRATSGGLSSNRFGAEVRSRARSAPDVGTNPWEVSRPNLKIGGNNPKARSSTALLRAAAIVGQFIRFSLYAIRTSMTVRNPYEVQRLKAIRLRECLEELGGMVVKLGQQLSMRMDLIPKVYCDEFKTLLDRSKEFPFELALEAIERQVGKPWQESFARIEPRPVGVASIACVYDGRLPSGERVAIKVRRPNIEQVFAADFKALSWTVSLIEFLVMVRPGILRNFQDELREMFLEELDFRIEARYQELFRRYLKKRRRLRVTAPRVFVYLSGPEVMVSGFVTGFKVGEIQEALARDDEAFLTRLEELEIKPKLIAKHLIQASYYTFYECPFFHGDPHPSNIFVRSNNRIVLVDFGACGVFSAKDRAWMWQMQEFYSRGDVAGMVQCVLGVMEPLPMMDVDKFKSELTQHWWHGYYGIKSRHAEWWERTSFRLWLALLELFRKYQLPMPFNLLRMIRATLLYDTVAAQLYPKINVFREFREYYDDAVIRSKERLTESVVMQLLTGPSPRNCFIIEQALQTGRDLLFRTQQALRSSNFNFVALPNKIYHAIDVALMFLRTSLVTTVVLGTVAVLVAWKTGGVAQIFYPREWTRGLEATFVVLALCYCLFVWLYSKRVLLRFHDPDNYNRRRGD